MNVLYVQAPVRTRRGVRGAARAHARGGGGGARARRAAGGARARAPGAREEDAGYE